MDFLIDLHLGLSLLAVVCYLAALVQEHRAGIVLMVSPLAIFGAIFLEMLLCFIPMFNVWYADKLIRGCVDLQLRIRKNNGGN